MEFNSVNGTHVKDVEDIKIHVFLSFAAIHTVARGHEMVPQGWAAFERTCTEVGVGELPQLLQYMNTHTTPTPTATPVKEEEEEPMDVGGVKNSPIRGWGGLSKMSNKMSKIELSQLGQDLFDFSGLTWACPLTHPSTHR